MTQRFHLLICLAFVFGTAALSAEVKPSVVSRYYMQLDSASEWERHEAARQLGILANQNKLLGINSKPILHRLIRNLYVAERTMDHDSIRGVSKAGNLLWSLAQFRDTDAIPAMAWSLRSSSSKVRVSAAWSLQTRDPQIAIPLLIEALRAENNEKAINQIGASIQRLADVDFSFDQARSNGPFGELEIKRKGCIKWWDDKENLTMQNNKGKAK